MIIKSLKIKDVKLIKPNIFKDKRGFFFESYNKKRFEKAIGRKVKFVQDNHSFSKCGVLRGLHFQTPPYEQAKLVRVIKGKIYDVAIDIRKNSNTYGKWVGEYLSSKNNHQLWIPEGFAHGFLVVSETAEVIYKTNNYYNLKYEDHLVYNDRNLGIKWPKIKSLKKFILNKKDKIQKSY